ncbi:hypothetical protein BY996DRAFT_62647 [Phakopsora pachyrhizi]|nr:hypothetical protein BY996DRAFT_62647 [Phakopsora pachyrhizi]
MCVLAGWWHHIRGGTCCKNSSSNTTPSSSSTPIESDLISFKSYRGSHSSISLILKKKITFNSGISSSASQGSAPIIQPNLMEDGSHPYFPGTPWDQLELASTVDLQNQPILRKHRTIE